MDAIKYIIIALLVLLLVVIAVACYYRCSNQNNLFNDNEVPMIERRSERNGLDVSSGIRYVLDKMKMFRDGWSNLGMIDYERLHITETPLASGGGGVVYRGTFLNQKVAIKAVYSQMYNFQDLNEISREASMLVRVAHPHITRLHGVSIHQGYV
jgi:hypothetical protein